MAKPKENTEVVEPVNPINPIESNDDNGGGETISSDDKIIAEIAEILDKENKVDNSEEDVPKNPETADGGGAEEHAQTDAPEAFSPDDELVERAVRAGLTLADAKGFASKESAERILSVIEASKKTDTGKEASAATDDPGEGQLNLPEISDEALEEIDPSVAGLIKSQSAALKALSAEIAMLKKAGVSAEAKGFFETQYGTLDESVRSHVDAVAKARLKQKFDLLEAGYKATGAKVAREAVFKEAVSLALSGEVTKAASEAKTAKIASRKGLVIAPAGGSSGKATKVSGDSPYADIVAELSQKGFE